jgi:hypothetical protein
MGEIKPGTRFSFVSEAILCLWKIGNVCRIRPVSVYGCAAIRPFQWRFRSFNNAVWLVMNDVILGSVLGAFVCENSVVIGISLHDWLKVRRFLDERRQG